MNQEILMKTTSIQTPLEQATAMAESLMSHSKNILNGAVYHYNTDSIRYQNKEMTTEAYLQELHCVERTIWEAAKLHARYVILFEQWSSNVMNHKVIDQQVQTTSVQIIRFMGIVQNAISNLTACIRNTAVPTVINNQLQP